MRAVAIAVLSAVTLGPLTSGCRIEGGAPAEGTDTIPGIETQVTRLLERSADAWNRGDLDGFMSGYLQAPTITYLGSSGLVTGWEAIRARYAPLFEAGALRDSLRFEDVTSRPIGRDYALATARYLLFRSGQVASSGPFTLVLWKTDAGWRIVHDQTGADLPASDEAEAQPAGDPSGLAPGGEDSPGQARTPSR